MKGAGGGKRKGRKGTRKESDDRPRGYETHRMRQLWRDIDDAKHKAGIGPAPEEPASSGWDWDLVGGIERMTALAADVVAWVTATAPLACELIAGGAEILRSVPIVGRLVELVPMPTARPPAKTTVRRASPMSTSNGVTAGHTDGAPDGQWIH